MDFRIGKLRITTKADKLVPAKGVMNVLGFSVSWLTQSSLSYVRNGYVGNPDIYTVVNKVARTAAYAPFKVFRVKDQKKHQLYKSWTGANATKESLNRAMAIKSLVYEEDTAHPMNALIENPNRYQKGREFTENSIGFKLITGERIWHVIKVPAGQNEGKPFEIYNLPPQHVAIQGDGTLMGIKMFTVQLGAHKDLLPEEIIFSRYWNPDFDTSGTHLRGLSPWKAGAKLMTVSNSGLTRSVAMLDNAGAAGVLYTKDETMNPEQAGVLKQKITNEVMNPENANALVVANADLGYINFGLKGSEMELNEAIKLTRERICSILSVPPVLINPDNSSYNNIQEAKKELISAACTPELDSLRDDWNGIAKLYGDNIYVDYDLSVYPELQSNMKEMADVASLAWWMTPNEKRLMMYMDEHEAEMMDEIFIPTGIQPMSDFNINEVDAALNGGSGSGDTQTGV